MLSIKNLTKTYEDAAVVDDVTIDLPPGKVISLIGPNGAGKSTVLGMISRLIARTAGIVEFKGRDITHWESRELAKHLAILTQANFVQMKLTVRELVAFGRFPHSGSALSADDWTKVDQAIHYMELEAFADRFIDEMSGGQRQRAFIAMVLAQDTEYVLLDEPTNHLDAESIDWLEQHLQQYPGTVIAVTHDRYFLDHVAGWILELDRGEGIPWKGNYSSWLEQKTKRMEMEEKVASKRRKTLERELDWVRMAPKARQAKGKARLNSYDKLLNEDVKEKEEKLEIFIPNGPRLGNKVIEAKGVAKAYGDKLLFDNLNFMLPPNGIVGVIGPNGAGKTTLFRLIMGLETVDKGTFEVGETVKLAYVDQQHKDIDPAKSVYQVISGGNELIRLGNRDINARAYLSRFNFSGADQEKLCGMLSGGERNRLHLAMALKEEGNVLLLDEPTNDIDVNTLRALEEGLDDFAGCAVVISHDRWFLDRICTHILAFEGNSEVFFFEGSYSEYEENKMKRLGNEEPKRVRYRKLMED